MTQTLRRGKPEDAPACGVIAYEAFKVIGDQHNYPPDFPSALLGGGRAGWDDGGELRLT